MEGQKYYFEVFHRSGKGEDHLGVYWSFDGFEDPVLIPSENLIAWTGIAGDENDNGLPDQWEADHQLDDPSGWGDQDHDGLTDFEEFRDGSDPNDGGGRQGYLLWEIWDGILGREVADLINHPAFRSQADRSFQVEGGLTPTLKHGNFGSRLSGLVTPTQSGDYRFAVSGNSASELWLSPTASPLDKQRIAFSPHWRFRKDWTFLASQQSVVVSLEAGQSYYIEALQKSSAGGWVGIAWKMAGHEEAKFEALPVSVLRTPSPVEGDTDRDFIADAQLDAAFARVPEEVREKTFFKQFGDPDRDGIPNWQEARNGTEIFDKTSVEGHWAREWWFLQQGDHLDESREKGAFSTRPSMTDLVEGGVVNEQGTANFYLSRMRAVLQVPSIGTYRLFLVADDEAELWVSATDSKFFKERVATVLPLDRNSDQLASWTSREDWTKRPEQGTDAMTLDPERPLFIEILHKERSGDDHVAVGWQLLGPDGQWGAIELLPAEAITSYPGDWNDWDDDYLPDSWEEDYGLNSRESGANHRETEGEYGDFDGDGLTNRREFLLGTNPAEADSDGDGVSDFDEVELFSSNPAKRDIAPPSVYLELSPDAPQAMTGSWISSSDGTLRSSDRRGELQYLLELAESGSYLVQVVSEVLSPEFHSMPLGFSINGDLFATDSVQGMTGTAQKTVVRLPWLDAGTHTLEIDLDNIWGPANLKIISLSILSYEGRDEDGNGTPDWLSNYFAGHNLITTRSSSSQVSPVCVEGISDWTANVSIQGPAGIQNVLSGVGSGWYANVPLNEDGTSSITASFEGGIVSDSIQVDWTSTNLCESSAPLQIRVGDSLKLTAFVDGAAGTTFSLAVDGTQIHEGPATIPFIYTFEESGSYQLTAQAKGVSSVSQGLLTVEVVGADFGPSLSVFPGQFRSWELPGIPSSLSLELDPDLKGFESLNDQGVRSLQVGFPGQSKGSRHILARLFNEGPIVARGAVESFIFGDASMTGDSHVLHTLSDGSRIVRVSYVLDGAIPKDFSLRLEMWVPDAVFLNGATFKILTAADFDENGIARIDMIKAPGLDLPAVCHQYKAMMGEELLNN